MRYYKEAARKTYERDEETTDSVREIIQSVRDRGDAELLDLAKKFDGVEMSTVKVSEEQIRDAYNKVSPETIRAIQEAAEQIRFFAQKQLETISNLTTATPIPGVTLGHRLIPIQNVGIYVPAGRYPLPSTALMLTIPAKVAGVDKVVAASPAFKGFDTVHPAVLVAMDIGGADEIYCSGGAQAIAALAYGTETVKKVELIAGPGNRFVAEAKRQVMGTVGIDSIAGPSEVLIIADEYANPKYVAADLLAQSEHDPNARATLITTSEELAKDMLEYLNSYAADLPTGEVARKSWEDNGTIILVDSIDEAIKVSDDIAPEHLEVQTHNAESVGARLRNFGSLFIGEYTPVAFGDYCSGTNHTLPTMSTAKYSNGCWVGTFLKTSFIQHISEEGCKNLSRTCMQMATEEGLFAHKKSVEVRLENE